MLLYTFTLKELIIYIFSFFETSLMYTKFLNWRVQNSEKVGIALAINRERFSLDLNYRTI